MLVAQNNVCAICKKAETKIKPGTNIVQALSVDHDHFSGSIRQLLCNRCNMGLGYFEDSEALLKVAYKYLVNHKNKGKTMFKNVLLALVVVAATGCVSEKACQDRLNAKAKESQAALLAQQRDAFVSGCSEGMDAVVAAIGGKPNDEAINAHCTEAAAYAYPDTSLAK